MHFLRGTLISPLRNAGYVIVIPAAACVFIDKMQKSAKNNLELNPCYLLNYAVRLEINVKFICRNKRPRTLIEEYFLQNFHSSIRIGCQCRPIEFFRVIGSHSYAIPPGSVSSRDFAGVLNSKGAESIVVQFLAAREEISLARVGREENQRQARLNALKQPDRLIRIISVARRHVERTGVGPRERRLTFANVLPNELP